MLRRSFCSFGTCMTFWYPNSFIKLGTISSRYFSRSLAISFRVSLALPLLLTKAFPPGPPHPRRSGRRSLPAQLSARLIDAWARNRLAASSCYTARSCHPAPCGCRPESVAFVSGSEQHHVRIHAAAPRPQPGPPAVRDHGWTCLITMFTPSITTRSSFDQIDANLPRCPLFCPLMTTTSSPVGSFASPFRLSSARSPAVVTALRGRARRSA